MGRDLTAVKRAWAIGGIGVLLAFALIGCGSPRPAPLLLSPLPTTTTTSAPAPKRLTRSTTTAPDAAATAAQGAAAPAPAAAPPTEPPVASTDAPVPTAPRGIAVKLPKASATTAPAPGTTATTAARVAGGTVTAPPTTAAPALLLSAPASRALPEGPFDVVVTDGATAALTAQPAAVCAVDAGRVIPLATGDCTIRATAAGRAPGSATVQIRRGDPSISWQLGATTPYTHGNVPLNVRATSGAAVRIAGAIGSCQLAGATAITFTALGVCSVSVSSGEAPAWNVAETVLTTIAVRALVTATFSAPATSYHPGFSAKVVMTQADRSLDRGLAFGIQLGGNCSLAAGAAAVDAATRTATIKVTATAPTARWCVLKAVANLGPSAELVGFTNPGCQWIWVGSGTPSATKPPCPA